PDQNVIYSTGLQALDQRLGSDFAEEKGIPAGSIVLILAPPESNLSTLFAQKVILNLLESTPNSRAYYMHSSRPRHVLEKEFHAYNWDVNKYVREKKWEFIDMWHITSSHVASSSKIGKIDIKRKTYLKQAYLKILQLLETENLRSFSVVDNLLWLKEDNFDENSSKLLDFFKELSDLINQIGGVHFFVLPKGILDNVAQNLISSIVSGIIEFDREISGNRSRDRLTVAKMMGVAYKSEILDITPDEQEGLRIESTGKI
ncbi:MAG: RAD55 family ATPase, partial [Candidatus Heimdallarchaeota archaeon]